MHNHIKIKIFIPLSITLTVLLIAAIIGFFIHLDEHIQHEVDEQTERLVELFKYSIDQDAKTLSGLSDFIARQNCLKTAWIEQDRQALLNCSEALFKQLRKDYRVTHFYFHSLDKVNFLRVHNPKRYGDTIDRFTLAGAIETQQPFHGIELGPYGTFTLRVVSPWWIDGKLAGYLELGEEIEHITPKISALTGTEILLLADKQLIDKERWSEGMKMMGRQEDWNLFPDAVVIDKSQQIELSILKHYINSKWQKHKLLTQNITRDNKFYYVKMIPLYDSNQQLVGRLLAQMDFTEETKKIESIVQPLSILFILIGGLLMAFFWFYLGHIEKFIASSEASLSSKITDLSHAENQLKTNQKQLEKEILHRKSAQLELEKKLLLLDESRKTTVDMMEDALAARKQAEGLNKELVDARIRAESASEAKSQFLSSMSHELRTPMNGMLGMAELLTDTPLNAEQLDYLKIINQSGQSLLSIINDILDFSKIETGKMQLDPISFDLEYTINDVISLLIPKAEEKGLVLAVDYTPDCPRQFIGDAGRLRQILMNLLGNAIKFTSKGYVVTHIKCEYKTEKQALLYLQIEDTGIGIDSDKTVQLFESFTQVDTSTTRKFGGTGLGLAISKKLVELMQGEIGAISEPGKGSTFWFKITLPIAETIELLPNNKNLNNVRILIVDDIEVNRDILLLQMQSFGALAEAVESPAEAIKKLLEAEQKKQAFDIAILDYNMPEIDGEALAKLIKSHSSLDSLMLLLLTSSSNKIQSEYYKGIGFSAYLCKPVHSELLKKTLSSALSAAHSGKSYPLITRHTIAESEHHKQKKPTDSMTFSGKVLLVEDVKVNQMLAEKILTKAGLQVDIAGDGEKALAMYHETDYDLIFMDCQMPIKDGYAATREIRQYEQTNHQHIPIIALTANAMKEDRDYCLQTGMDDFISKPFKTKEIHAALEHWHKKDYSSE